MKAAEHRVTDASSDPSTVFAGLGPAGMVPLVAATRGGSPQRPTIESVHYGSLVALGAHGDVVLQAGDVHSGVFARSALKPLFAVGMVRAGLELEPRQLALACASHSGGAEHLEVVTSILRRYGLGPADLRNTPGVPIGGPERRAFTASGARPDRLHQNCSGKHAAMMATAVACGWDPAGYLEHDHPVAALVRSSVEELTGCRIDPSTITRDGCGAEVYPLPLVGLARAYGRLTSAVPGSAEYAVAQAMSTWPELVGGQGRDVTALMRALPGAVAKDGAEGVCALALAGGACLAVKIADGASRARVPAMLPALRALGVQGDLGERLEEALPAQVLGWGEPVGSLIALLRAWE
ncbi:asparaginase [uncultured Actinomyces sp.]|uniref:asparaginase n=1 Tax=uncultured Actinomyces sp. TaxID=249061 RepID=UPI002804AC0C|nr:asparaginase [uncultured Actinomyces sp.]